MKALRKTMAHLAILAAMIDTTPSRDIDISIRKRDKSKPKPSPEKTRKRKAQKLARKQQRHK